MENARVLLLYADRYYLIKQIYPFGLDMIANYLRCHGHDVTVEYPFLPGVDLESNLLNILEVIRPGVIGIGIRNIDTCMSCETYGDYGDRDYRTFYFLPDIKLMVDLIGEHAPAVPVVVGGGGFTISPAAILEYIGAEYGIAGEGEEPFRRFIEAYPNREEISRIPGLIRGGGGQNPVKNYGFAEEKPMHRREGKFQYAFETAGLPVQVKRGCNQGCSYCVEPIIEGREFHFRKIDRVVEELRSISVEYEGVRDIFFVDTEFNLPDLTYCSRLVKTLIRMGLHERFSFSSQFLPAPFDSDFARLLSEAGFSVILTCDSFSDQVLSRNHTSYRERDILKALDVCEEHGLACTVSMIFGLPGETHETMDHSLEQMRRYAPGFLRRYEYTVGARIYHGTRLGRTVGKGDLDACLYGTRSAGFVEPCYFCVPESPLEIKRRIEEHLGYGVSYENRYDENKFESLAVAYMVDQGQWGEAIFRFRDSPLPSRLGIYRYLFRKLTAAGKIDEARFISETILASLSREASDSEYQDQKELVGFYLSMIGG